MLTEKTCKTCQHIFWRWDYTYNGKGYIPECRKNPEPRALPLEGVCSDYIDRKLNENYDF